jgi:DNA-binding NarL/FixJ family response regulator
MRCIDMQKTNSAQPRSHESTMEIGVCVEDSALRRRVCSALTVAGHKILARESQVDELISRCGSDAPACVVVGAPRTNAAVATIVGELQEGLTDVPVVLVCERANSGDIRKALSLGAGGIVLSDELDRVLAAVIAVACAGQVCVPRGHGGEVRARTLTTREKQILGLVVMGLTNAQIAAKLFLAESTVKSHLSSAFAKLDVSSRNEAVNVILDPQRGPGLGILSIPAEPISSGRRPIAARAGS